MKIDKKTGAYTETIFQVVFGRDNPSDAFSMAEKLCDRLIAVRVPIDQKSLAKDYVAKAFNRINADQSILWTLAHLLGMDQQHITSVDPDLLERLEKRDARISLHINATRGHREFDRTARWVFGELTRHVATSTEGLQDRLTGKKHDRDAIYSIVKQFSQQRFEDVIGRLIKVTKEDEQTWITPSLTAEQVLVGVLGGGNWFRDEVTKPILLWKEKPIQQKKFYIRCNQEFMEHCTPKLWPAVALQRVGRPRSKKQNFWVEIELLDWLGSIWVEANMADGFWRDNGRQIMWVFKALEEGGAFILRNRRPSPRGTKYVDEFVSAMRCIRDTAAARYRGADFKLWFDWDWKNGHPPARFKNVEKRDDAIDVGYDAKLDEAYGYQSELAKLMHAQDHRKVQTFLKNLERKKIPPYLISDWLKHAAVVTG